MLTRLFHLFNINSLNGRLRFCFIGFIVFTIILASIPFVFFGKQHEKEDGKYTIEKTINMQEIVINSWFEERKANIKNISEQLAVKTLNKQQIEEMFLGIDRNYKEFEGIGYVNKAGMVEVDTSDKVDRDLSKQPYFIEAKNGKSMVTDVLINEPSQQLMIMITTPIIDKFGEFQGLIYGMVDLDTITDVITQFQDDARETYIINHNGMFITKPRQGGIGEYIDSEIYEAALSGNTIDGFYTNYTGQKVLGSYRWVHENKWMIIVEITKNEIFKPFYLMASMFTIVSIFVSVIGYVVLLQLTNQIVTPIEHLLIGTKNIGRGNFTYRIDGNAFRNSSKEFHQLRQSFNHMSKIIKDYVQSIAESEERFRTILENSKDMIAILDLKGNFLYISPAGKDILQYEDEELIGENSYDFIHPDDTRKIEKNMKNYLLQVV